MRAGNDDDEPSPGNLVRDAGHSVHHTGWAPDTDEGGFGSDIACHLRQSDSREGQEGRRKPQGVLPEQYPETYQVVSPGSAYHNAPGASIPTSTWQGSLSITEFLVLQTYLLDII